MSVFDSIATAVLASSAVSGLVIWFLKTYLKSEIAHHFQVQIESIKQQFKIDLAQLQSGLTVLQEIENNLAARRLKAYPKLVEQIYRIRNMARQISDESESGLILGAELQSRVADLEEELYEYRIDLDHDGAFPDVHAFKNLSKTFSMLVDDLQHDKNESSRQGTLGGNHELYPKLDGQYSKAVERLSALGVSRALIAKAAGS